MGWIKNVVEPLAIIFMFTTTTLINRTRTRGQPRWRITSALDAEEVDSPTTPLLTSSNSTRQTTHSIEHWLPCPDTTPFHNNLISRFLRKFPFLIEILYWALTYWPYQLLRALSAHYISSNPSRKSLVAETAKNNAIRILNVEKWIGIAFEQRFQAFILNGCKEWVMKAMCGFYLAHICVGILFLGYAYTYFPRSAYHSARRTLFLDNILAFLVLSLYRCTPPRLMPESYHFVDVLHPPSRDGPNFWASNPFQLTLAAMPSLHFGTSSLLGISTAVYGKHFPLRVVAPLYPAVMAAVVVATANHWVLDCIVGLFLVLLGWKINWVLLALRPFEEWVVWACRVQKPEDGVERRKDVLEE